MKKTFSNDKTYVSHAVLSYGYYDNSCAVDRANVQVLREKHPGQGITTEEAREILKYAAELERQIETVVP